MKKIILAALCILTGLSISAKDNKKSKKSRSQNEITSVALRHTACYGRCPDYIIEVNKDGMATFTGIRFTTDTGVFRKNIGKATAKKIIDRFSTYKADTCKDRYESRVQDLPGLMLTIKYPGKVKTIQNVNLGPERLRVITSAIDSLTGHKVDETWHAATPGKTK